MVVQEDADPKGDKGADPPKLEHIQFKHPRSYVYRTCSWLERFGVLPRAGGLDDQDKTWVEDAELYFAAKGQVGREYEAWKREQGNS